MSFRTATSCTSFLTYKGIEGNLDIIIRRVGIVGKDIPDYPALFAYIYPRYPLGGELLVYLTGRLGRIRHFQTIFLPEGKDTRRGFFAAYKGNSYVF